VPKSKTPLTPRQQRFVDEYLVDLNATKAAERAGYSAKTARVTGAENLTKPAIAAAIEAGKKTRAQASGITAQRVLDELALIAFSDIGELVDFTESGIHLKLPAAIPAAARRAVASIKIRREVGGEDRPDADVIEFKLWDKVAALSRLAEHLGLVNEVQELLQRIGALERGEETGGASASGAAPANGDRGKARASRP